MYQTHKAACTVAMVRAFGVDAMHACTMALPHEHACITVMANASSLAKVYACNIDAM